MNGGVVWYRMLKKSTKITVSDITRYINLQTNILWLLLDQGVMHEAPQLPLKSHAC